MSNQEAIALLRNLEDALNSYCELNEEGKTAFRMAIEALSCSENPNNSDCISRQAAIDMLKNRWKKTRNYEGIGDDIAEECELYLKQLPSAQPEVIRCTECKHYREYDSEYVENAVVVQCMADRYPISETIPDGWFCAGAERRTDD